MKTTIKQISFLVFTSAFLLGMSSCKEENQVLESMNAHAATRPGVGSGEITSHYFDAQTFAAKIEARLKDKVPGYGYCIVVNGQVAAKNGVGNARYNVDAPQRNYTENVIQDIGSCTKYFAALLAMKYLESAGAANITVALEKKVYLYLPYYFQASNDFKKVTFRDLMAHTSGIINNGSSLGGIQKTVEDGINETTDPMPLASPKPFGQYDYQNINYVLLRYCTVYLAATQNIAIANDLKNAEDAVKKAILMDELMDGNDGNGPFTKPNSTSVSTAKNNLNLKICNWYLKLLQQDVFQPAGLTQWNQVQFSSWGIADNQKVKYYNAVNSNVAGYDSGDHLTDAAGAGGLKLSAMHMAQIITAARANMIVPANVMAKMKAGDSNKNQMGFDNGITGTHGVYYHKNGAGAGNAVLFDFDGPALNVQLVITTNMKGTEVTNTSVWATLFDQSWK